MQAWLPVHQIYQGNCGGPTVPEVLDWYGIKDGVDNGEYLTLARQGVNWDKWHAAASSVGGRCVMAVKALYDYDYPSKDRQELFGDDMLVNVLWTGNMMFCAAGVLPGAEGDDLGGLQGADDRPVGGVGPRLRPSAPGGLADRR